MKLRGKIEKTAYELCQQFSIKRLGLFGSIARGEESDSSDIDFYAEFERPTPETMPDRYFGFIEGAKKMYERPVQLVTPGMIRNPYLKRSIERDLVIIYG